MPRLNHATLLENLVTLEVTRVLASSPETTLEFASAFSMPPLTQCWHRNEAERRNNPRFNASVMTDLINGNRNVGDPTSYSALMLDCLQNAANRPVVPYAGADADHLYPFGGPSGALLAALLRRRLGQDIRVWSNDLAGVQGRYHGGGLNAGTECPHTREYADMLADGGGGLGVDSFCSQEFPASISSMAAWRNPCKVRIGFLDPDSYVADNTAGEGQVDSEGHRDWLANLYPDAVCTAGIMFFSNQQADARPQLIATFHNDAFQDYPRSVVFRHNRFMVGVKLRCYEHDPTWAIIDGVQKAWNAWSSVVGRPPDALSLYVDGQASRPGMEYKVIEANAALDLQEAVNRHIKDGWVPLGSVAVVYLPTDNNWWFYQAMVNGPGAIADHPRR